jgi:hypothetical protein
MTASSAPAVFSDPLADEVPATPRLKAVASDAPVHRDATIVAPAAVGRLGADAIVQARAAGLIAAIEIVPGAEHRSAGEVLTQDPAPGTPMGREGVLTLCVARGADESADDQPSAAVVDPEPIEDDTAEWFARLGGTPILETGSARPKRRRKPRPAAAQRADVRHGERESRGWGAQTDGCSLVALGVEEPPTGRSQLLAPRRAKRLVLRPLAAVVLVFVAAIVVVRSQDTHSPRGSLPHIPLSRARPGVVGRSMQRPLADHARPTDGRGHGRVNARLRLGRRGSAVSGPSTQPASAPSKPITRGSPSTPARPGRFGYLGQETKPHQGDQK